MLPDLFRVIGSDRCLTAADLARAAQPHPLAEAAWEAYATYFGRFTGSRLDPMFHRLQHPAARTGTIRVDADETVFVVGAGPSLLTQIDTLKQMRGYLRIFTSPRGAEVLSAHGIVPDLVLIEHQTAVEASVLARCPLVAADWRTPRALLTGVGLWSLFVPSPLPTWGLWPATAVAMALEAGAPRVALLGVDLGTAHSPDRAYAPLRAALELLAFLGTAATFDCGPEGARKQGWLEARIQRLEGARVHGPLETELYLAPTADQRARDAREALAELRPVVQRATVLRALATEAQATGRATLRPSLQAGIDEVMGWRQDPRTRVLLQECLGVECLPRLWRSGIDASLRETLWRPLLLATYEITAQAAALAAAIAAERAA